MAKRTAYEAYVTDALKIIATNTGASTAMLGGPGSEIKVRYADLVSGKRETRTSAEIINGISAKLEGMAQT